MRDKSAFACLQLEELTVLPPPSPASNLNKEREDFFYWRSKLLVCVYKRKTDYLYSISQTFALAICPFSLPKLLHFCCALQTHTEWGSRVSAFTVCCWSLLLLLMKDTSGERGKNQFSFEGKIFRLLILLWHLALATFVFACSHMFTFFCLKFEKGQLLWGSFFLSLKSRQQAVTISGLQIESNGC